MLKKGVRLPELKTEAFAILALSWYSAGSASYSSWAHSQLAPGGAGDVNPFPERLSCCWLRAVALLHLSENRDQQGYGAVVPSKQ